MMVRLYIHDSTLHVYAYTYMMVCCMRHVCTWLQFRACHGRQDVRMLEWQCYDTLIFELEAECVHAAVTCSAVHKQQVQLISM